MKTFDQYLESEDNNLDKRFLVLRCVTIPYENYPMEIPEISFDTEEEAENYISENENTFDDVWHRIEDQEY